MGRLKARSKRRRSAPCGKERWADREKGVGAREAALGIRVFEYMRVRCKGPQDVAVLVGFVGVPIGS